MLGTDCTKAVKEPRDGVGACVVFRGVTRVAVPSGVAVASGVELAVLKLVGDSTGAID